MNQTNIKWIKANAYNLQLLSDLIKRVHDATEQSGIVYRGWITDQPEENGIINLSGIVSEGEMNVRPYFFYTEAVLLEQESRIRAEINGELVRPAPVPGTKIMATITTDCATRGFIGVVTQGQPQSWPNLFSVEWTHNGKIAFLRPDEYVPVSFG